MTQYYKFLTDEMSGGYYPYPYEVGKWTKPVVDPEYCRYGYHVVERHQILPWILANLWEVETRGKFVTGDEKTVFESIRLVRRVDTWNERTQRLLAADFAAKVLHIYEKDYPNDDRPRKAIIAARDYANGKIDADARAAACAAARDAAYDAFNKWALTRFWKYVDGTARPIALPKQSMARGAEG